MKKISMLFVAAVCATFAWAGQLPTGPVVTGNAAAKTFTITPASASDRYIFLGGYVDGVYVKDEEDLRTQLDEGIVDLLSIDEEELNNPEAIGMWQAAGTQTISLSVFGGEPIPDGTWMVRCVGFRVEAGAAVQTTEYSEVVFTVGGTATLRTDLGVDGPAITADAAAKTFTITPASASDRYIFLGAYVDGVYVKDEEDLRTQLDEAIVDLLSIDEEELNNPEAIGMWQAAGTQTISLSVFGGEPISDGTWMVRCVGFRVEAGAAVQTTDPSELVFEVAPTALESVAVQQVAQKMLRNGQLVIRHGDKLINAAGAVVE